MNFKGWLFNEITAQEANKWLKNIDTDDVEQLKYFSDALEELGYPNVEVFRDAVEKLRVAISQGMDKSPSYGGVFWEIRRRVIRLLTEVENWLARLSNGVPWSGPFQK